MNRQPDVSIIADRTSALAVRRGEWGIFQDADDFV